jgi:hypothetical protein
MTVNKSDWLLMLAVGGVVGYLVRWQKDVNYAKTYTAANIGSDVSGSWKYLEHLMGTIKKL